jgi:hypothetical protein
VLQQQNRMLEQSLEQQSLGDGSAGIGPAAGLGAEGSQARGPQSSSTCSQAASQLSRRTGAPEDTRDRIRGCESGESDAPEDAGKQIAGCKSGESGATNHTGHQIPGCGCGEHLSCEGASDDTDGNILDTKSCATGVRLDTFRCRAWTKPHAVHDLASGLHGWHNVGSWSCHTRNELEREYQLVPLKEIHSTVLSHRLWGIGNSFQPAKVASRSDLMNDDIAPSARDACMRLRERPWLDNRCCRCTQRGVVHATWLRLVDWSVTVSKLRPHAATGLTYNARGLL